MEGNITKDIRLKLLISDYDPNAQGQPVRKPWGVTVNNSQEYTEMSMYTDLRIGAVKHNFISSCIRVKPCMFDSSYIKCNQMNLFQYNAAYFDATNINKIMIYSVN